MLERRSGALTRAASRNIFWDRLRVGKNQEVSRSDRWLHLQGSSGADVRVAGIDARRSTPSRLSRLRPETCLGLFY